MSRKSDAFRGMIGSILNFESNLLETLEETGEDDTFGLIKPLIIHTQHLEEYEHITEYADKISDWFVWKLNNIYYDNSFLDVPRRKKKTQSYRGIYAGNSINWFNGKEYENKKKRIKNGLHT
mgnify:CR=1 FL=1